jgi:hypothetical protein
MMLSCILTTSLLQFFQNYNGTCVNNNTCQAEIVNIDATSGVSLYQLATVGVTDSLSINQQGEACFTNKRFARSSLIFSCPCVCPEQRGDAVHHHAVDKLMIGTNSVRCISAGVDSSIVLCTLLLFLNHIRDMRSSHASSDRTICSGTPVRRSVA